MMPFHGGSVKSNLTWDILPAADITAELILGTLRREIAGFRLPGYCGAALAARLGDAILAEFDRSNYGVRWCSREVMPDGAEAYLAMPFAETDVARGELPPAAAGDDPLRLVRRIRAIAWPELAPVDRLRLELDEIAPLGARIRVGSDGRKTTVGLPRVMDASRELLHADTGRKGCLTANVYLRLPESGGATRIWNHRGVPDGSYEEAIGSYLFGPGEIPADTPSALVEPEIGELVVWNPLSPHVVLPFAGGPRVSLQAWLRIELGAAERFAVELLN